MIIVIPKGKLSLNKIVIYLSHFYNSKTANYLIKALFYTRRCLDKRGDGLRRSSPRHSNFSAAASLLPSILSVTCITVCPVCYLQFSSSLYFLYLLHSRRCNRVLRDENTDKPLMRSEEDSKILTIAFFRTTPANGQGSRSPVGIRTWITWLTTLQVTSQCIYVTLYWVWGPKSLFFYSSLFLS